MGIPSAVAVMRAARGDAAAPPPPGGGPAYLLYYRGTLDAAELRKLEFEGDVGEPGMWGRLMNGSDPRLSAQARDKGSYCRLQERCE